MLTNFEDMQNPESEAKKVQDLILTGIKARKKNNPVKSKKIEDSLKIKGPTVRTVIKNLRRKGHPIVSTSKGYWYDGNWSEMDKTIESLRQRGTSILKTANELEKAQIDYREAVGKFYT
jgi:biotin operon repressor